MERHHKWAGEPGFEGVQTVEDLPPLMLQCPLSCSHPGQSCADTAHCPPGLVVNGISFLTDCTLTLVAHPLAPGRALRARYKTLV